MDYLVTYHKKELKELIEDFKEKVGGDEYAKGVLKLVELIDVFLLEEFLDGKPISPMINEVTPRLESSDIAKSSQHRLKTLLIAIEKNRYRESLSPFCSG